MFCFKIQELQIINKIEMRRSILLALFLTLILNAKSQDVIDWKYISPKPGAIFINPENNITFSSIEELDILTFNRDMITVSGTVSGIIEIKRKLSNDGKTLLLEPVKPFINGEEISVVLKKGTRTKAGKILAEGTTNFRIKKNNAIHQDDLEIEFINNARALSPKSSIFSYNNLITYGNASLPDNMPVPQIMAFNNPSEEYIFLGIEPFTDRYTYYAMIIDRFGTPVFYREWPSKTVNLQVSAGNKIIHKNQLSSGFDQNSFIVLNDKYEIIDTLQVGNGYKTNTHDGILLENGNHFLMIYDSQLVGMDTVVEGGNPNATVKGFVFQELDEDHNVIFQWRSWDHFEITDANHVDLLAATIDYVHVNAFDTTADGNFLLCCRHMDEITKINLITGEIMWRFGKNSQNNMFEIDNDTLGFSYPHDIQQLANGNLTMYDNGNNHDSRVSSGVEYSIDEENLTASLEWKYTRDPEIFGPTKGGMRRLKNGNTLIGWGTNYPITATEVNNDLEVEWELSLDSCISYRTMAYDWETSAFTTNVNTIDFGYYNGYEPWPVIFQITNNMDDNIAITSASHHSDAFSLETSLPVQIGPGETTNMIVQFFPDGMGNQDFEDVLTINSDGFFSDTLNQRISRQIKLKGTTIDHSGIADNYNSNFTVYPNPVSDGRLTIESLDTSVEIINIYDVSGRLVYNKSGLTESKIIIDISEFNKGIYLLKTNFSDGKEGKPVKLLVQ